MSTIVSQESQKIIEQIIALLEEKVSSDQRTIVVEFARRYFAIISYRDLEERGVENLCAEILLHWKLLYQRQLQETKIWVYNPTLEQHGWQSNHTVIQIVCDDMPFLVNSVRMAINRFGFLVHLVLNLGNVFLERNDDGQVIKMLLDSEASPKAHANALLYFEIDQQPDESVLIGLKHELEKVLQDVAIAVSDWSNMREKVEDSLTELKQNCHELDNAEVDEVAAFLHWLKSGNFTFIGCRDYQLIENNGQRVLRAVEGSGFGVLKNSNLQSERNIDEMPAGVRHLILSSQILFFAKTRTLSTIHRSAYTDCVEVKRFNKEGQFIGQRRFIGLFTSGAYNSRLGTIPVLRHKMKKIIEMSGFYPEGHSAKALLNIVESLPRDDVFQSKVEDLFKLSMEILQLQDRQGVRLFILKDAYHRFLSCLVFVPQNKVDAILCEKMQSILAVDFDVQEVSFRILFSGSALACVHFTMRINPDYNCSYDVSAIEKKLIAAASSWQEELRKAIYEQFGESKGVLFSHQYMTAFPSNYREIFSVETAVEDINYIEALSDEQPLAIDLYSPSDGSDYLRLKVFQRNQTTSLSEALPILENMGLKVIGERPYCLRFSDHSTVWINDFDMIYSDKEAPCLSEIKDIFQRAFSAVWLGRFENDAFNRLILGAGLNWKQVSIFRAYAKYFRQIGIAFSEHYIANTLASNTEIVGFLMQLFELRFNPSKARSESALESIEKEIIKLLKSVASLDEDRILQYYLGVIKATLRVNTFQTQAFRSQDSCVALKLNPSLIQGVPRPVPMYEIYVYSPRFEGVHLRCAKVSRGGLRWSDRREDFRTEILGLMKAQQVKNACIVPQGAKGGFVVKKITPSHSRDEVFAEGKACYSLFIQSLLDITDNMTDQQVHRPKDTICYDDEDPYLVVAADKGTATFSDIANEISQKNNFWLGDAFASGGSSGYDHKKMAITARGAWESVKRNFREMGRDTQSDYFTAIGIGDMAGDVFGNGVLLSPYMKLIAAFNHESIFIDPNPRETESYKERKRLFKLPRSCWHDYDCTIISEGGGVFSRRQKMISVSPQMAEVLDITKSFMTPNELISAILKAKVDLLWNGGIGTFIKSEEELNIDVSDRANDSLRINASQLRCKVVGEGGNLGLTQLARVEYELNGGRVYTDFIDNSAGVNCSDHEVNIKVLLNAAVSSGKINFAERNKLLAEMSDEVADLVLQDNYHQTQALSLAQVKSAKNSDLYIDYMNSLEEQGKLDPELEFLPNEKRLMERKSRGEGLTRPELAVLFSYSKNILKEEILNSEVPEDPYLSKMLRHEFPIRLHEEYAREMESHILRREIIATQVSNTLVNEMGFVFISRIQNEIGASVVNIVRAFTIAQKVFGKRSLWHSIEALDLKVEADVQFKMMRDINRLIHRATRWFLTYHQSDLDINRLVFQFAKPTATLANRLDHYLVGSEKEFYEAHKTSFMERSVAPKLSSRVASSLPLFSMLNVVQATRLHSWSAKDVARTYFLLGEQLETGWLSYQIINTVPNNSWSALLRTNLYDDLVRRQCVLTVLVLEQSKKSSNSLEEKVNFWLEINHDSIKYWQEMLAKLKSSDSINFLMLVTAVRELFMLGGANAPSLLQ